jgi:hypothetical protein
MADFIGKTKGFGEEANSIPFNTYVPELDDDANIQNAFELFYFGDSSVGTGYDSVNSLYAHILNFDSRITSNATTVNGLVSTIGSGNVVVGTGTSQTLTNKSINLLNNTLSGTLAQFNTALSDADFATLSGTEILTNKRLTTPKINEDVTLTATATELNVLDGITASTAELNIMDGVTATAAELNTLDGITASVAELNILDGVTSTAAELNILDGATLTTTELNYVDGVTSAIQTQLNSKASNTDPVITGEINTTGNVIGHITINSKSTSYTLVLSDDGDFLEFTNSTSASVTVPTNLSVEFPIGTVITILQAGTGQLTIVPASGVTVNSTPGLKTRAQWSVVTLIKRGTNTWLATGDLSA